MVRGYEPGRYHMFDPRLGNFFLVKWKRKRRLPTDYMYLLKIRLLCLHAQNFCKLYSMLCIAFFPVWVVSYFVCNVYFYYECYLHNNSFACIDYSAYSIINNLDGGSALPRNDSKINLTCSEDFYEENLTCVPQCNAWSEKTPYIETTTITIVSIASALGTICGVIGIFGSIVQYKSMWELMGIILHNHTSSLYTYCIFWNDWCSWVWPDLRMRNVKRRLSTVSCTEFSCIARRKYFNASFLNMKRST